MSPESISETPRQSKRTMSENARIALEASRLARLESGAKIIQKTPLEKLEENRGSLRLAVNAKCYQCEGENADPNVKNRIGTCAITSCALWSVRPYRDKTVYDMA